MKPDRHAWAQPLRIRAFRLQFLAQASSVLGSTLSPVALSLGVLGATGSARDFSLMLVASSVPTVLFLLVGGVWADRLPRHKVMVTTNLICAVAQTTLGVMLLTGAFHLWLAVIAQAGTGVALAFYFPSVNGLTAESVPSDLLQPANSMLSLTRSLAGSVGPLVAAVLAVAGEAGAALLFDAFTFLVSGWFLARLTVSAVPRKKARNSFMSDLGSGFREVTSRPWVWSSIVGFMVGHLAEAAFLIIGPLLLLRRDGSGGGLAWGAIIAALSVGQVAGDVLAMRLRPRIPLAFSRLIELLATPVYFALGLGAPVWIVIAAAVPAGVAITLPDSLWFTVMQRRLPGDALSRVSSYDWLGSLSLRPVGYLLAGLVATAVGPAALLVVMAVIVVVTKLAGLVPRDVRTITLGDLDDAVPAGAATPDAVAAETGTA